MKTTRRNFIGSMAAGGAYAALPGGIAFAANAAAGGALPLPTDVQRRWADMELGMFFHYDIPIFGGGNAPDPGRYNPEKLDTDQWMEAAKAYGAKYVVLTAKHGAGFMQWQSDIYPYGVKQSPWRGGKGDLVRDFVTSARKYGLKPGLYTAMHYNWFLGVRRSNGLVSHKGYYGIGPEAQKKYAASCEAALTELFTKYGELFEIWFDGGVRPPEEGGPRAREIIERLQPNAILFQGPKNARNVVRWVGNERGVAGQTNWSTLDIAGRGITPGHAPGDHRTYLGSGDCGAPSWCPAECDFSIQRSTDPNGWFYGASDPRLTASDLMDIYYKTVGRNGVFLMNVPPSPQGVLDSAEVRIIGEFTRMREAVFSTDLAAGATAALGSFIGTKMFDREGARIVKPLIIIVIVIFLIKLISELFL